MGFSVVSENTVQFVDLHNCDCSRIYYTGNKLIMEMDWMEISPLHPCNTYDKAHQSGEGIIEIYNPVLMEAKIDLFTNTNENTKDFNLNTFNFSLLEFLTFDVEINGDTNIITASALFDRHNRNYYALHFTLSFQKSVVMWDELKN